VKTLTPKRNHERDCKRKINGREEAMEKRPSLCNCFINMIIIFIFSKLKLKLIGNSNLKSNLNSNLNSNFNGIKGFFAKPNTNSDGSLDLMNWDCGMLFFL